MITEISINQETNPQRIVYAVWCTYQLVVPPRRRSYFMGYAVQYPFGYGEEVDDGEVQLFYAVEPFWVENKSLQEAWAALEKQRKWMLAYQANVEAKPAWVNVQLIEETPGDEFFPDIEEALDKLLQLHQADTPIAHSGFGVDLYTVDILPKVVKCQLHQVPGYQREY
jgi:hypothetical protein